MVLLGKCLACPAIPPLFPAPCKDTGIHIHTQVRIQIPNLDNHHLIPPISQTFTDLYFQSFVAVIHSLSHVWLPETSWTAAHQASLSFTVSQTLLKLMSIESMIASNHLILCHPLLLFSVFPSQYAYFISVVYKVIEY
ncbi:unnamed protein product [Rangifer tarandus platyrhynchus]|uniref:Uncharacterized protein n=1 Tax=Rangifer tarandus platyrhynchus TaxID=3082113 RepID=A0ABN9A779_RANTA|nr:unnamed protein product [Rangifer tarandus platyrhynchus]